jgi:nucleoside phosphorylase
MKENTINRLSHQINSPSPPTKVDYAIFSAMPEELEEVKAKLTNFCPDRVVIKAFEFLIYTYNNSKILLAPTGIGTTFAAAMLTFVHKTFQTEIVLLWGCGWH